MLATRARFGFGRKAAGVVTSLALSTVFAGSASANLLIRVDKATQHMIVSEDGTPLYSWPVSTGRAGYDTPSGAFRPFRMDADHHSDEWDDAPMPDSIFFTREGHAIHGSYETRQLGTAVSHGCVRLSPRHAATLFALVTREGMANTRVVIDNGEPADGNIIARRKTAPATSDDRAGFESDDLVTGSLGAAYDAAPRMLVLPWYGRVLLDRGAMAPIH